MDAIVIITSGIISNRLINCQIICVQKMLILLYSEEIQKHMVGVFFLVPVYFTFLFLLPYLHYNKLSGNTKRKIVCCCCQPIFILMKIVKSSNEEGKMETLHSDS